MADTTSLSSFPNNIDTFDRVSDISEQQGTLEKSQKYKKKIDDGKYADAEKYLRDNEDLAQCAINASMFNKHSDAIVALEEKAIVDRQFAESVSSASANGLIGVNNKIDTVQQNLNNQISSVENDINNISNSITTIEENHKISFAGKKIGMIQEEGAFYSELWQQSFYIRSDDLSINTYANFIFIPNTDWILQNGNWNQSHNYEKYLVGIEGVIEMKSHILYPIGYNDGTISVNAAVSQNPIPTSYSKYMINIRFSGIDRENIKCVRGIIKYVTHSF